MYQNYYRYNKRLDIYSSITLINKHIIVISNVQNAFAFRQTFSINLITCRYINKNIFSIIVIYKHTKYVSNSK